jgi:hypothetical protein
LHYGPNDPQSKGHDRDEKHSKQKDSDFERYASGGHGMDKAPGEENLTDSEVDKIVDDRETKQT